MNILGKKELERTQKKIIWGRKQGKKIIDETTKRYSVKLRVVFNEIKHDVIKRWYMNYGGDLKRAPGGYVRKLDLFKITKVELNKSTGDVSVTYDENYMNKWHRVSNEYIYENSFVKGWHGGADKLGESPKPGFEEPHPHPKVPYWRYPTPWNIQEGQIPYKHWFERPAARTLFNGLGPHAEIKRQFQEAFDDLMKELEQEQAKKIDQLFDELEYYIKVYLGKS